MQTSPIACLGADTQTETQTHIHTGFPDKSNFKKPHAKTLHHHLGACVRINIKPTKFISYSTKISAWNITYYYSS